MFVQNSQSQGNAFIYGDKLPDAPILAARGEFKVGVKTAHLIHYNQIYTSRVSCCSNFIYISISKTWTITPNYSKATWLKNEKERDKI